MYIYDRYTSLLRSSCCQVKVVTSITSCCGFLSRSTKNSNTTRDNIVPPSNPKLSACLACPIAIDALLIKPLVGPDWRDGESVHEEITRQQLLLKMKRFRRRCTPETLKTCLGDSVMMRRLLRVQRHCMHLGVMRLLANMAYLHSHLTWTRRE